MRHFPVDTQSLNAQVVVVHILQEVSAGGEWTILGTAVVAAPVPLPVLSDLPPVRPDTVPGAYRTAVLGNCLRCAGRNGRSGWAAVRFSHPLHRSTLRRLVDVTHHTTTPYRYAPNRTSLTKRRVGSHRRRVQRSRQSAQVWKPSRRRWLGHRFAN